MNEDLEELFLRPPYWLMFGLPWPSQDPDATMAEAAFAVAPDCVPRRGLAQDVDDVLGFTGLYAKENPGQRTVWFTDVTRWLDQKGSSWASLGVDWEYALNTILDMPILGLYMTISRRAYCHLINTAETFVLHHPDGTSERLTDEERQVVHDAFEQTLSRDWPSFVQQMLDSGRLTFG